MDKKENNLWSTTSGKVYLGGVSFDLSENIKAGSEGERRNSRPGQLQKALVTLLQTGKLPEATSKKEEPVTASELRHAILSKAMSLLSTHPKFSHVGEKDRAGILAITIRDLPECILPEGDKPQKLATDFTTPSEGQGTKDMAAPTPNLPIKPPQAPTPMVPIVTIEQEDDEAAPREFVIGGDRNNLEELEIFFAGDEIHLSDPDQHVMLATILVRASTDPSSEISKVAIANSVSGAERAAPLFIQMKDEMNAWAYGSSATLTPTKNGQRIRVTVPINSEDLSTDLTADYDDQAAPSTIALPGGFGS